MMKQFFRWTSRGIFCALLLLGNAITLQATQFDYGDLTARTVVYQSVIEESTTNPTEALFEEPSISGDSLIFSPTGFGLNMSNGSCNLMDGTLTTTIASLNDFRIEKIILQERGDYTLLGSGTAATWSSVSASLFVRITEVDGVGINPCTQTFNLTFDPSGGTYNLIEDSGMTVPWDGSVEVDVDAMLAAASIPGKATKVDISLDNTLAAFSQSGTFSYIKKKQNEGITLTATPEPATLSLLAIGGAAILLRRRKV